MITAVLGVAALFGVIAIIATWENLLSEPAKWDMAAGNMRMEGCTEFEIIEALGPRPES